MIIIIYKQACFHLFILNPIDLHLFFTFYLILAHNNSDRLRSHLPLIYHLSPIFFNLFFIFYLILAIIFTPFIKRGIFLLGFFIFYLILACKILRAYLYIIIIIIYY